MKLHQLSFILIAAISACGINHIKSPDALKPTLVSDEVQNDTDDPAIWVNSKNPAQSLVLGTDKDSNGGLYAFNLEGKIVNKVSNLKRPNNVDIAYGFKLKGKTIDIAVLTEREVNKIRVYSLPDLKAIDDGGIEVFLGEKQRDPMGVALYTNPSTKEIQAIVGRKSGPADQYLWQYKLTDDGSGKVVATVVRKFGKFSGKKEIESIVVDNELGYIFYSDEGAGIHKYFADPKKGDQELAFFGKNEFRGDIEGLSIYKTGAKKGYLLVSDQQANRFSVYNRAGGVSNPHSHTLIKSIPFSTLESDGSEVSAANLGSRFPKGLFVAMSNGKVFHFYDWRMIETKLK